MYQQQAIEILARHYGHFHPGLIFTVEVLLNGLARNDIELIDLAFEELAEETELLGIKPLCLADIVAIQ